MKNLVKILSLAAWVAVMFASCEKNDSVETEQKPDVIYSGDVSIPQTIDGVKMMSTRQLPEIGKKGYLFDINEVESFIDMSTATDDAGDIYKTIKFVRADGSYFYAMIENLRYSEENNDSWIYDNNPNNLVKYGRLYTWNKAKQYMSNISMRLPRYDASGKPVLGGLKMRTNGQLPNFEHIKTMLSINTIPDGVRSMYTIDDVTENPNLGNKLLARNLVSYDIFLFGYANTNSARAGYHSLAGMRDNIEFQPTNPEFRVLTKRGNYWTSVGDADVHDAHYTLKIDRNSSVNYGAFINALNTNAFGYSVRAVFDPFM